MVSLAEIRKALAALSAAVAVAVTAGLLDNEVGTWVTGLLGALVVAVTTYAAPANRPRPPRRPPP